MKKLGKSVLSTKPPKQTSKNTKPSVKVTKISNDEQIQKSFKNLRYTNNKIPVNFLEIEHKGYIVGIGESNLALWNGTTMYKCLFGYYDDWIKHFLNIHGTRVNNVVYILDNKAVELLKIMFKTERMQEYQDNRWWQKERVYSSIIDPKVSPDTPVKTALKVYQDNRVVIARIAWGVVELTTTMGAKENSYTLNYLDNKKGNFNPKIEDYIRKKGTYLEKDRYQISLEVERVLRKINTLKDVDKRNVIIDGIDFDDDPKIIMKIIDVAKKF